MFGPAPGHSNSTGNYVVAAYDVTSNVQSLNVNQTVTDTLATPYSTDQWTFSAAANTQVQFQLLGHIGRRADVQPDRAERVCRVQQHHGQFGSRDTADSGNIQFDRARYGWGRRRFHL